MATYIYTDVDLELSRATDGDITKDGDKDAIINSITNILETMPGSRRMLPEFAENPNRLLFEPIDEITARKIGETILESIENWDDRINITGLDIQPIPDEGMYICRLVMFIKSKNEIESVDFILRS